MRSIIKGIILGIFLSIILSPLTVHAKAPNVKLVASSVAYSMQVGVQDAYSECEIVLMDSGQSWWQVWSNGGKGWWDFEEELNRLGVSLDENGMIMDGTVYTMPEN